MKTIIIILFALGFATQFHFNTNTGSIFTPAAVVQNFTNDFSKATEVKWSRSSNYIIASFSMREVKVKAYYTLEGILIGTAKSLNSSQIPAMVKDYLASDEQKNSQSEVYLYSDDNPFDDIYLSRTRNKPTLYCVKVQYLNNEHSESATFTPNRKAYNITVPGL